jgi:hypothetical protein
MENATPVILAGLIQKRKHPNVVTRQASCSTLPAPRQRKLPADD